MHLLIAFVWAIIKIIFGLVVSLLALELGISSIYFLLHDGLPFLVKMLRNPRCPSCHSKRLKRYNFPEVEDREFQYYACTRCDARYRFSTSGETVTLPQGSETFTNDGYAIIRPTSVMLKPQHLYGHDLESLIEDPLGSWFGSVQVALPGEEWPQCGGIPMLPLCQLRCESIPTRPAALENFELVCVYIACVGEEAISPHGERWVLRTYASLEDLVPIAYPGDPAGIRACPVTWRVEKDVPHNIRSLPEAYWFDFHDNFIKPRRSYGRRASKVGGHGWFRAGEVLAPQAPRNEFVF